MLKKLLPDRKGSGILLLATTWVFIGLAIAQDIAPSNPGYPHTQLPDVLRVGLWIASAGLGFAAVWSKRIRGYALGAMVMPLVVRIVSYFWAWVTALVPGGPPGVPNAWYSLIIHLLMLGFLVYVAMEKDARVLEGNKP